jgi:hypothetical protein
MGADCWATRAMSACDKASFSNECGGDRETESEHSVRTRSQVCTCYFAKSVALMNEPSFCYAALNRSNRSARKSRFGFRSFFRGKINLDPATSCKPCRSIGPSFSSRMSSRT